MKSSLPTVATPAVIGVIVLSLIVLITLYTSVPFANKTEVEAMRIFWRNEIEASKAYTKNEIEWVKLSQDVLKKQVESIDSDRREQRPALSELKAKIEECDRRIDRLEDMRYPLVTP